MNEYKLFSELDFLLTYGKLMKEGFTGLDIAEIISYQQNTSRYPLFEVASCSGIAYSQDKIKIVQKKEFLDFVFTNYGLGNASCTFRDDLLVSNPEMLDKISFRGCFVIPQPVFESFQGNEYTNKEVEKFGFVIGKSTNIPNKQITQNELLYHLVNNDNSALERLASSTDEGIRIYVPRGKSNQDFVQVGNLRTWLLIQYTEVSGKRIAISDWGLESYDSNIPLIGVRKVPIASRIRNGFTKLTKSS